jgi:hypothetical protein
MSIPDKLLRGTLDGTTRTGRPHDSHEDAHVAMTISHESGNHPYVVHRAGLFVGRFGSLIAAQEAYPDAKVGTSAERAARAAGRGRR